MFKMDNIDSGKSLNLYEKIGRQEGLLRNLEVPFKTGLTINNKEDIENRIQKFGRNDPILKEPKGLYELILKCLEDQMLRILLLASFVSLVIGVAQQGWAHGWIEGFSIFLAVFIVVTISSYNDLSKEQQFAKLNKENEKKLINVRRNSKKIEINNQDLLVGDIIYLEIGNIICADCIILEGGIEVDQSSLTGESDKIKKSSSKNPFLISGSMVTDGGCEAIICAVGVNSTLGKSKLAMQDSNDKTPLQEKLETLADQISNLGILLSIIIFAVMVGKEILNRIFITNSTLFDSDMLDTFINAFIICVTVTVVAIPEGLPMAVTIALAYSVLQMKEENNLVRHIDASETMGNVNNICTDKTGTLTEGNMFVRSCYFEGEEKLANKKNKPTSNTDPLYGENLNSYSSTLFVKSIVNNVTAYAESKKAEIKGNSTEVALLRYLRDSAVEYEKFAEKSETLKYRIPFKSENKYMGSIYHDKEKKVYHLYLKGAPEILFKFSNRVIGKSGNVETLTSEHISLFNVFQNEYASRCERTLAFAYIEINEKHFNQIEEKNNTGNNDIDSLFEKILSEKNMTLIAMVGIADPPRSDVIESIKKCSKAGVFVRMVTGDNINTALAISKEVGILSDYEYNLTKQRYEEEVIINNDTANTDFHNLENLKFYALEGKVFREICGGYKEIYDDKTKEKKTVLNDPVKFSKVTENLKVIARASPTDKFLLVLGLKELKNIVAVTGDGTNDAPALKKSDVGFAMGKKGTDIAKDASDIVLLNDSFSSVVTAIKYGRNVYDCIRKFIQFQLTTNIVAVFMTLLGGMVLKDAPLNAIQMLWVNLIMDSLASLALATEHPSEKLLNRKPYPREESMITPSMMRNILIQAAYQIVLLSIFLFFGEKIFGVPDDRSLSHFEWNDVHGYHFTIFFNIFVFLQVFNSVNARKLEQHELNVFEGIEGNNIYIYVQAFIVFGQIIMVQFGGRPLRTKPLKLSQHMACIIIASTSLIAGYIGKKIRIDESEIPKEGAILEKLTSFSKEYKDKLPSRGYSFRSESRTYMPTSHKR
jgi:P-type Ca2+ transporter type 2B